MAIADLKEQSDSIFVNLIQNFSSYILSDPDTNQIYIKTIHRSSKCGGSSSTQDYYSNLVSVHHCKSKLTLADTTYIFRTCQDFIKFLYTIEDKLFPIFHKFNDRSKVKRVEKS